MKFDIEEYKNNPERKLILRNKTNQGPAYWDIDEIQVSLGNIIVIKVPNINLDFPTHTTLDKDYNLKHDASGIIGTLEFANEQLTMSQFIDRLINLSIDCSLDFSCEDGDRGTAFGVTKLKRFDTIFLLLSMYGGGHPFMFNVSDKIDISELQECVEQYLSDYFTEFIYINTADSQEELWGISFEFENADGSKFRRLAIYSDFPFFDSRQEAEQWIADHPYKDFDEEFDNDYCSNPRPVLIDRWSIRKDGECIQCI